MRKTIETKTFLPIIAIIAIISVIGMMGCAVAGVDTTAPTVSATSPMDEATGVAVNTNVTATFSEEMDAVTITATSFTLKQGSTAVAGGVTYSGSVATFNPTSDLAGGTVYTANITTGATDLAGIPIAADEVWTFTTVGVDASAPNVVSTIPANLATGVAVNSNISATFSESMDAASITTTTFTLKQGTTAVAGAVTYDIPNKTAIFAPDAVLAGSTTFTATVTTGATDSAANPMASAKVWSFTTASPGLGPSPVNLGTAGNYVILAKTAISTVPASDITGDIGLSPAAESFITGFSQTDATGYATSPQITGFIYAADMAPPTPTNMTTAISDMEAAYSDAAGRVTPDFSELGTGEIGGLTLSPGLYNWTSTVTISSDVTISGASNDVWIFQTTGDLTVGSAVNVTLSGGALPKNIFWQVAGAVTVGTNSHVEGILLSSTAITLGTGTSLNGRALAQSQVALNQNTVVEPAP